MKSKSPKLKEYYVSIEIPSVFAVNQDFAFIQIKPALSELKGLGDVVVSIKNKKD